MRAAPIGSAAGADIAGWHIISGRRPSHCIARENSLPVRSGAKAENPEKPRLAAKPARRACSPKPDDSAATVSAFAAFGLRRMRQGASAGIAQTRTLRSGQGAVTPAQRIDDERSQARQRADMMVAVDMVGSEAQRQLEGVELPSELRADLRRVQPTRESGADEAPQGIGRLAPLEGRLRQVEMQADGDASAPLRQVPRRLSPQGRGSQGRDGREPAPVDEFQHAPRRAFMDREIVGAEDEAARRVHP